jgi:hypothetical protein
MRRIYWRARYSGAELMREVGWSTERQLFRYTEHMQAQRGAMAPYSLIGKRLVCVGKKMPTRKSHFYGWLALKERLRTSGDRELADESGQFVNRMRRRSSTPMPLRHLTTRNS